MLQHVQCWLGFPELNKPGNLSYGLTGESTSLKCQVRIGRTVPLCNYTVSLQICNYLAKLISLIQAAMLLKVTTTKSTPQRLSEERHNGRLKFQYLGLTVVYPPLNTLRPAMALSKLLTHRRKVLLHLPLQLHRSLDRRRLLLCHPHRLTDLKQLKL